MSLVHFCLLTWWHIANCSLLSTQMQMRKTWLLSTRTWQSHGMEWKLIHITAVKVNIGQRTKKQKWSEEVIIQYKILSLSLSNVEQEIYLLNTVAPAEPKQLHNQVSTAQLLPAARENLQLFTCSGCQLCPTLSHAAHSYLHCQPLLSLNKESLALTFFIEQKTWMQPCYTPTLTLLSQTCVSSPNYFLFCLSFVLTA